MARNGPVRHIEEPTTKKQQASGQERTRGQEAGSDEGQRHTDQGQ